MMNLTRSYIRNPPLVWETNYIYSTNTTYSILECMMKTVFFLMENYDCILEIFLFKDGCLFDIILSSQRLTGMYLETKEVYLMEC